MTPQLIRDPARKVFTQVLACRSCQKPVYFSLSPQGKRAPYDVDAEGRPTREIHFIACPDAKRWRK
jgi:hypothetical protein